MRYPHQVLTPFPCIFYSYNGNPKVCPCMCFLGQNDDVLSVHNQYNQFAPIYTYGCLVLIQTSWNQTLLPYMAIHMLQFPIEWLYDDYENLTLLHEEYCSQSLQYQLFYFQNDMKVVAIPHMAEMLDCCWYELK